MSAETIKSYVEDPIIVGGETRTPCIMQATVGTMDMVLMPAGWMFWERVQGNHDVIGVRRTVLLKSSDLAVVNDHLTLLGKPSATVQAFQDVFATAGVAPT